LENTAWRFGSYAERAVEAQAPTPVAVAQPSTGPR